MPRQVEPLVMRGALERTDRPAAMALLLRGSTFTLYGGSVLTRWIGAPSSSRSTSSGLLLSPHSSRWSPRIHRSPGCVIASSGGAARRPDRTARPARRRSSSLASSSCVEAQQAQVEVHLLQLGQFERQQVEVPLGERGRLVVGDAVGLDLLGRQVRGDVDRHLLQAQLLRRLPARVADDDHAVGVDDDRLAEAELPDARPRRRRRRRR